jgi:hypothetical protein
MDCNTLTAPINPTYLRNYLRWVGAPLSSWEIDAMSNAMERRRRCPNQNCLEVIPARTTECPWCHAEITPDPEAYYAHRVSAAALTDRANAETQVGARFLHTAQGFMAGIVACMALTSAYFGYCDREARKPLPVPPPSVNDVARASASVTAWRGWYVPKQ